MWTTYILDAFLVIALLFNIIKNIKNKKIIDALLTVLMLPFLVFLISSIHLGGSPATNAKTAYELYQEGHYYLCSHNNYTEVTLSQYNYMVFIQKFGYISLILMVILMFIFKLKKD